MKITDTIYQVEDTGGGVFLLVGDEYITMVDTGVPNSEGKIFAQLEALGRKASDVKHILITHTDGDHIGSLPALVQATGAQVYAQRDEADVVEGRRATRAGAMITRPVNVDRIVHDGEVLPLHGGIRVVETRGHTLGHTSYLLLSDNLLFVGDCMVNTEGLGGSRPQYTYNTEQAKETVRKLADLAPDSLTFGHGTPIVGSAAEQIKKLAESS
jgi:glyoxylase-like metal-dependent hydrolase (beta-lactamase superfamily II)